MTWQHRYRRHLRSREWRYLKARVVNMRGRQCEICGAVNDLHLHHKTYLRFGHERIEDVELLCHTCHRETHRQEPPWAS
jgi:hypothetical protein